MNEAERQLESVSGRTNAVAAAPAAVEAVRHDTAQEIAELNLVEFIDKSLRVYLLVLGLADVLPNDFSQNLRQAIKEVCCAEDFVEIERSPNIQHPAVRRVLIRLISNLSPNIASALSDGNLLSALQNIVLLAELSRVAGIRIPAKCIELFPAISAFPIQGGQFGQLVKRAKTLLGDTPSAEPVAAVVPAPGIEEKKELPFARNYREVTEDMIGTCNISYLIACSREAQKKEDWEFVERFQREIIRRNPKAFWAHINLAQALGGLKRYQEALDERRLIATLDPDDTENQKILSSLEEEIRRKVPRIERYEDFTGENLEILTEIDLNSYIKQTKEKRDWQNMLRFAEEYKRRMPNNTFGYIYSAIALEKLGRLQQALEVREALEQLFVKQGVIERVPGDNAWRIRELKSHIKAKTFKLVQDTETSEDAHDWEKSVELRRQLIKLDSSVPANFYALSFSLEFLGRFQESLEAWEKFLTMPGAIVRPQHSDRLKKLQYKAGQNRPVTDVVSAAPGTITQTVEAEVAEVLEPAPAGQPQIPDSSDSVLLEAPSGKSETSEPALEDSTDLPLPEENPAQPFNVDTSSFSGFLNSLAVAVGNWPVSTKGEIWRTIPKAYLEQLKQAIEDFQTSTVKNFPKAQYTAFWKSFDHIYDQIHRGTINSRVLQTLIERFSSISAQETSGA